VANVQIDFRGVHADGNVVVIEKRMTATLTNGRPYAMDYLFVFELRDGRVERVREYMDTAAGNRMVLGEG